MSDTPITWPKARDIGRIGDIEFCNPGGGGGGKSSRTRIALIALMAAMEADNADSPSRDWWAIRMQPRAAQQTQGGTDAA